MFGRTYFCFDCDFDIFSKTLILKHLIKFALPTHYKMNKFTRILVLIVTCLAIGYFSGLITRSAITTWYPNLIKPSFNPPNWIFGPVWSFLYCLMGIGLFLIYQSQSVWRKWGFGIFAIQLGLNFLWSFIFFQQKQIGWALVDIFLLWLSIICMIFIFYKINKTAAYIQLPYLVWVSFAGILNYFIFILNANH